MVEPFEFGMKIGLVLAFCEISFKALLTVIKTLLLPDIFGPNGEWNLKPISFHVPPAICFFTKSILRTPFMEEVDTIRWDKSLNGEFTSEVAYSIMHS